MNVGLAIMLGVACMGGCGRSAPPETGARQAAQKYLEAFCRQDWAQAYDTLDADSRARDSADQYTQWVTDYRRRLGFDVESSAIVSCRETGETAAVEVAISGHAGTQKRTKAMALMLSGKAGHWGVALPAVAGR